MVKWFDRTPREVIAPLLRPRHPSESPNRVLLEELSPDRQAFLGQSACLQLSLLDSAARAVATAPSLESRVALAPIVRMVSARVSGLVELLAEHGGDPVAAMRPFSVQTDDFHRMTMGEGWHELVLSLHVTAGLLGDFFVAFAGGLPPADRDRVRLILTAEQGHGLLVAELQRAIDENPRLASRLALWGRSLVGDTLLQMYAAVAEAIGEAAARGPQGDRLEPVFTEIVANHTRRMDALGLTA